MSEELISEPISSDKMEDKSLEPDNEVGDNHERTANDTHITSNSEESADRPSSTGASSPQDSPQCQQTSSENSDGCSSEQNCDNSISETNEQDATLVNCENQPKERKISENEKLQFQALVNQCELKLEELCNENKSLRCEMRDLRFKQKQQELEFEKCEKMRRDLLVSVEKLTKECNSLQKEKESIVILYANSEKEVIQGKKVLQEYEKKLKDCCKERDSLLLKLKNATTENSKLASVIESKMIEIAKLQKENERLSSDVNSREVKIKWLQNKLNTEVNAHEVTQTKLDQTHQRLNEMKEEARQVRKDCQDMIKCYQEADENKSTILDDELKQKLSELEMQKQEKSDQEQVYVLLRQELEALKRKQWLTMEENNSLTLKINSMEKERLEYEQTICKLKDSQNLLREDIADLKSKLAEMEGLKLLLDGEKEKSAASLREVERLRLTNAELQADLDACHVKEGDRLDFVEKLTAKTMLLQSDHSLLEVKARALEDEVNQLRKTLAEMQLKNAQLEADFAECKNGHENEMFLLAQKFAESAKNVEKLNSRLEEAENENRVLKKRHMVSIKELSRELHQSRKQLDLLKFNPGLIAESSSLGSRSSSCASLHIPSYNDNSVVFTNSSSPSRTKEKTVVKENNVNNSGAECQLDKEVLIERIIHLQKLLAKKADKIDFLEDHIEHLVREMRKRPKNVDFKNV